ncbi:autotransporter outer membrane beta-barrel domain-containing protein [Nocardioides ultimimeridianus]
MLGQQYTISGRMPVPVRRPVVLIIDGTRRSWSHTTRFGHYRFILRAPSHPTALHIRVRAPWWRGHQAMVTRPRLVPISIPQQRCVALPAGTTTWSPGSQHELDCQMTIPVGSTLEIGAGATLFAGQFARIDVQGSLDVRGTSEAPVRLRAKSGGLRWSGISASGAPDISLTHAFITGAGSGVDVETDAAGPGGRLVIDHSRFGNDAQGVVSHGSTEVSVTNSEFVGGTTGVWLTASHPTLTSNLFHDLQWPISLSRSTIAPDQIHDNVGYSNAASVWAIYAGAVDVDGQLATGPESPTAGTATDPAVLTPVLGGPALEVLPGATLTIGPGVVKAAGEATISVEGTLDLQGTDAAPALLTSVADDSVGGKAGAGAHSPAAGDWGGIGGAGGQIDAHHASIRYADAGFFSAVEGTTLSVTDSDLEHNNAGVFGIGSVSVTHSHVTDGEGVVLYGGNHPRIADNTFTNTVWAIALGGMSVDLDDLHGNTATDAGYLELSLAGPETSYAPVTIDADGAWPTGPGEWNPTGEWPAGQPVALTPVVGGTVTISAGASTTVGSGALKFSGLGTLDVAGGLTISGTTTQPAVLSSDEDNRVGLAVAGEGPGSVEQWDGISWHPGAHVSVSNAVLRGGGLRAVGTFTDPQDPTTLSNVEFANTTKAIDVAGTTGCSNPFGTTAVTGSNVWLGSTGTPGGLSALATVTDPGTGDTTYAQAKAAYDDAVTLYGGLDSSVTDNTIPFADWACADWSFPVTPVQVDLAQAAPYPAYAQAP